MWFRPRSRSTDPGWSPNAWRDSRLAELYSETIGSGPRLFLVHGSIGAGWDTWDAQRPLADRFTLVVPHRSGYAPNPPLERIDFERQADEIAELVEPADHLVGHSYGGVVSLLAAAKRPDLGSLTVVEPPAFGVARGDPAVDELIEALGRHFASTTDPVAYLAGFLPLVGSRIEPPASLSPKDEQNVRSFMTERNPWEAEIPMEALTGLGFPKLVVSGGHHRAFEAVADVLEDRLRAERATITGARHSAQRTGEPFNRVLGDFVDRAERSRKPA